MYFESLKDTDAVQCLEPHPNDVPVRYPVLVSDPQKVLDNANKLGYTFGDWYNQVVAPIDVDLKAAGYLSGMCPHAEEMTQHIINLPTSPRTGRNDVENILSIMNDFKR